MDGQSTTSSNRKDRLNPNVNLGISRFSFD